MWSSLKPMARMAYAACQALWSAGFALAGRFDHNIVQRWSSAGGGRVLLVAPHPDDEATGCGGTLALHSRAGDKVTLLQVTDGQGAQSLRFEGQSMAHVRRHEAQGAAAALGAAALVQLALSERQWREDDLWATLRKHMRQLDPDVIYAPSCVDYHPDHLRVARALAAALDDAAMRPRVRVYAIGVPLTARLANCIADTSAVTDAHDAALAAYRSQWVALLPVKRLRAYHAAYYRATRSAEAFWELSARDYRTLMARGDWLGPNEWSSRHAPYRSLRARPFTDPLAYTVGAQARHRLKQLSIDD